MIKVLRGFCALKIGKYWIGVCKENHYTDKNRKTSKKALSDAKNLDRKLKGLI